MLDLRCGFFPCGFRGLYCVFVCLYMGTPTIQVVDSQVNDFLCRPPPTHTQTLLFKNKNKNSNPRYFSVTGAMSEGGNPAAALAALAASAKSRRQQGRGAGAGALLDVRGLYGVGGCVVMVVHVAVWSCTYTCIHGMWVEMEIKPTTMMIYFYGEHAHTHGRAHTQEGNEELAREGAGAVSTPATLKEEYLVCEPKEKPLVLLALLLR